MGAVVDGGSPLVIRNEDVIQLTGVAEAEFETVCDRELAEIERRRQRYIGDRERINVKGRLAIVIDDGVATGATTRAALRAARVRQPDKLILAVPVGPPIRSRPCAKKPMKSSASKSTRSLVPSAISTTIFAKSQTRK
jgi:putative phosphoribosyl transferase